MSMYPKKKAEMFQLAGDTGKLQTAMEGQERIYSREDTKKIITMARKAKTNKDLVALGKFICSCTKRQDKRKPEYVKE